MSPAFSIVVPTRDGRERLGPCLEALAVAVSRSGRRGETIVVVDGSTDGSARFVRAAFPGVRVIEGRPARGFAVAANRGLAAAAGEWIGLVNDDVVVDPDWVAAALREATGGVGAIATQILVAGRPGIVDSAGDEYATCGLALPGRSGRPSIEEEPRDCFSACAAAAFYRRSALAEVGPMRESLEAYYEDVDLGFRLNLAGFRCRYAPRARAWHAVGASYGRNSWKCRFNSTRNRAIVFAGHMPPALFLRHLPLHAGVTLAQIALGPTRRDRLARALGTLAVLRHLSGIAAARRHARRIRRISDAELESRLRPLSLADLLARTLTLTRTPVP